jgi:hypothetical protein
MLASQVFDTPAAGRSSNSLARAPCRSLFEFTRFGRRWLSADGIACRVSRLRTLRFRPSAVDNENTEVRLITKFFLALVLAACCLTIGFAADTFHPLDVKPGEWESTMTIAMNGPPPIPAEALARMTPEQRARLEEKTKSLSGRTIVHKTCIKKERLDKPLTWGNEDKACAYTLGASTGSLQEVHVECSKENRKSTGTIRVQAVDQENIKGAVQMTLTFGDRTSEINSEFTAKYVGPTCTTEK